MAKAHTASLFYFAGIFATMIFTDFDSVEGYIEARGFDCGGEYESANVAMYCDSFEGPTQRDMVIAKTMNFIAAEMLKQAAWQAA